MKLQTFKVGDIVVTESFVNATMYRILDIIEDQFEIAVVKIDGNDIPDGIHPASHFLQMNTKQKEENNARLKTYWANKQR
jgi:hypothetical protein